MSDTFAASNRRQITTEYSETRILANGINMLHDFDYLSSDDMKALREFIQHERDKELGRWRWPENPNYVVYPSELYLTPPDADLVTVFNERTGQSAHCRREGEGNSGNFSLAARAYFAAHPEPTPWHDARDGQLWLIRFSDFPDMDISALVKGGRFIYNDPCHEGTATLKDPSIVGGKQIWPEVKP